MIEKKNKYQLFLITFFIDILLFYIYLYKKLCSIDFYFIEFIFMIHCIFFISLYKNYNTLIDFCHLFMFLCIFFIFYIESFELQSLVLFLISLIQILWILKGYCIMNTRKNPFSISFQKLFTIGTFLFTLYLSFSLGKKSRMV